MLQLKDLLRRKGMTAKELAVKIGISEGALSKSLSGNPTLERIEQIAAALGVAVPELFAPQPTNTITCPKCGTVLEVKERE